VTSPDARTCISAEHKTKGGVYKYTKHTKEGAEDYQQETEKEEREREKEKQTHSTFKMRPTHKFG